LPLQKLEITTINLYKIIDNDITGFVMDYPVETITLSSTVNNVLTKASVTKIEYDNEGAKIDESGTIAHYPKVSILQLNPISLIATLLICIQKK
jgi:type IV secretory pathway TrbL component